MEELIKFKDERMKDYAQYSNKNDRCNSNIESDLQGNSGLFIRNEFSRDRDRIKFSRSFRRLEHKAQIYSNGKGDHFRTRLTHTLEVSHIARSLARNLNLNEDLVEAISLGHDIGHTPFGHQGERVLDKIMSGEDDLSQKIKFKINYGGFKHNFHSLKILDKLEIKHDNYKGMNLTWQVLEGILKHTKIKRHKECKECGNCWDIKRFVNDKDFLQDYLKHRFSVTLEGQVVAIADEIAQRQHDIDDGLMDKDLNLNFNEISKYLISEFEKVITMDGGNSGFYIENLKDLENNIKTLMKKQNIEREELYKTNTLVRNVLSFFIKDVTIYSLNGLKANVDEGVVKKDGKLFFNKQSIDFSPIGEKVNEIIENYIKRKILNSYNVNRFDGKSIYIIKQVFKAYYTNPRQMPEYILERLLKNVKGITDDINDLKVFNGIKIGDIDFSNSKPQKIDNLIKLMKLEVELKDLEISDESVIKEFKNRNYIDESGNFIENGFVEVNNKNKEDMDSIDLIIKAMLEVHYAYLSVICDYIAGMTDNYAFDEFKNLYLVD